MRRKSKINQIVLIFFVSCSFGFGQTNMHYEVSFIEPHEHYAEIKLFCKELETTKTSFELPVWSPGYYKILDFPQFIVDFKVKNTEGESLKWSKKAKNLWEVENGVNQNIVVTYRVFANHKSVAESNIDEKRAFIMPNTMLMHIEGKVNDPVTIDFFPYEAWDTISTGLQKDETGTFYANNFDVLYDSPVYIGNQTAFNFEHHGKSYHLAVATPEGLKEKELIGDLKKIIDATTSLMRHVPYENYSFIMMEEGGGGLEHWNSQAVFTNGSFDFKSREHYIDFLNFITHEYFHLYNVKAIRPIELGPFDYGKENYTDMLWVSEGITVYYEYLLMIRAGLLKPKAAMDYLSNSIKRYENIEGNQHMSLSRSSFDIWLNFLSREDNVQETTISYYNKGPIIGFLLDLEIRNGSNNQKSLDDVMRFLYNEYYLKQKRGFKKEEFWDISEKMAGTSLAELKKYVETITAIDYQKYLNHAGLKIDLNQIESDTDLIKRSYSISEKEKVTKEQAEIRKSLFYPQIAN